MRCDCSSSSTGPPKAGVEPRFGALMFRSGGIVWQQHGDITDWPVEYLRMIDSENASVLQCLLIRKSLN